MYQTTFDLQNLVRPSSPPPPPGTEPIDTDNLTNTDNWEMQNMWMPDNTPCTYSRCSAVSTPDNLYVFWNHFQEQTFSSSSALLASQHSAANNWGHTIQLLEMDGKTEPVPLINTSEAYYAVADVSVTLLQFHHRRLRAGNIGDQQDRRNFPRPLRHNEDKRNDQYLDRRLAHLHTNQPAEVQRRPVRQFWSLHLNRLVLYGH